MRPGWLEASRVAAALHCPPSLLDGLAAHGMFPAAREGMVPSAGVALALRARPWLKRLDTPMCGRELDACVGVSVPMPPDLSFDMAGRSYCVLWRALDAMWSKFGDVPADMAAASAGTQDSLL